MLKELRVGLRRLFFLLAVFIVVFGLITACTQDIEPTDTPSPRSGERLQVVASTSIIADVVRQVSGDLADLSVLIPPGSDPHTFEPRPQDIAVLSSADLVFTNGLHLEETLEPILDANVKGKVVVVSDGIDPLSLNTDPHDVVSKDQDSDHPDSTDPHTWMDPNNVIIWTENIRDALSDADPENASTFQSNAEAYTNYLRELDEWIREQVAQIPSGQRKLVSDHATFGYFADEYGFNQVGLVIPGLSTNAAPSAQELADLQDRIRSNDVMAIFVGKSVNPALVKQVAADTGTQIVLVYTGSLSEAGGEADSYLKFMRYNVSSIIEALK